MRSKITTMFKWLRLTVVISMVAALLTPLATVSPVAASTVNPTTAFTAGGVVVNGTRYAKSGQTVTLTVNTSSDTNCVRVSGAHTGEQTVNGGGQSTWTFNFTTGTGDGTQAVNLKVYSNKGCTNNEGTGTASYTLDNTAPVVTGAVAPPANGAGWNKSDVTITWSASDAGSGVASGPTPGAASQTADTSGITFTSNAADRLDNTGSGSVLVKLDKTAPTISGSRAPAANANGWNNTDVTASFTCSDGLAGIKSCSGPTTLTSSAANQSVTGTAVDNADNSASATVSGISIDKVAPTLSGAPTTSPNAAGWYNGNVAVHWTAADVLSGPDPVTVPANSTITGEGSGLTASASVADKAGNTTTATSSPAVNIDRTAPNTTASAPPAWNNNDVTVNLTANDALSGVAGTFYTLDGGAQQSGTSITLSTEGIHTLQFWSVDKAGNTETAQSVQVKIDRTSPTISHTQAPIPNVNGWNKANVTVTFVCNDSLSGIASCTAPQTVTAEGQNQAVTGTATDNAGNTATDPAKVSIDKTAPTISATRAPAANANGWNNTDVTVTFACADPLSGIDSCPGDQTFGEGGNQTASGTATDAAGNNSSASITGINVDKTDPTLSGAATVAPNGNGWYNGNVTIHWTAADALSDLDGAAPPNSTITGEGADLSASATVKDKAGNQAMATVAGIKIDRTAPGTAASAPTGWQNNDIVVGLIASDNLSGVGATYFTVDGGSAHPGNEVTISTDGTHTIQYWSVDNAGNNEAAKSVTVQLDKQSPTISHTQAPPANANGWNNTSVTVTFTCTDQQTLSGLASCTGPQTVTTEGKAQPLIGLATDTAGNSTQDSLFINIDKTAPTITAVPDRAANGFGWYKDDVTVHFDCADDNSGVDGCTAPVILGEGANQSATGSVTDAAGNTANATLSGINVDKTAPGLGAAPLTTPNPAGWYNSNVTMTWTCVDSLSGINGACPGDNVITGEGDSLFVSASVSDKAGNTTTADSPTVKIDRQAPSTDVSAPGDWINNAATVTLTADDALSGVAVTYYTLDGGAQQPYNTGITIGTEGIHTLRYWSVDVAGNAEPQKMTQVKIDHTAPTIDHTLAPEPNATGWNKTDVTVTFVCSDTLSGILSCTAPQTVTAEGKDQIVTGTAVDNADNSETDPASVSIDKTAPTISAAPDRAANSNGWYNNDVTITYTCADALSGIAGCPGTQTFVEGAGQTAEGTATDAAGNSVSTSVPGINVDKTAPSLAGAPASGPNSNGWYNGNVTIHWTCSDALSGIVGACPPNSTITSEGTGLIASASVSDQAGNSTSSDSSPVNIDRTAPSTSANAPNGWNNQNVSVSLTAEDALSGVQATYFKVDGGDTQTGNAVALNAEGVHSLQFWSVDKAGNAEGAKTVTVKIDKTPPAVTHTQQPPANPAGWNNTDVTVTFNCTDPDLADGHPGSGVASCTGSRTVAAEGASQPVVGTAVDNADNSASDTASVSIDKTAPIIHASRDPDANDFGWNNSDVTVSFTCFDALSGIAGCPAAVTRGEGANQSADGTATDIAGNHASTGITGINVDKTDPLLSGSPTTNPNGAGWYKDDVTIHWTASDALSEVNPATLPADSIITSEGNNLSASTSVSDKAGNAKNATVSGIKIDRTNPDTTISAPSGWQNNSVTLHLDADDNLSGVDATYYKLDHANQQTYSTGITISSEGTHTVEYWSVDRAGNAENAKSATVMIDLTNPTIQHTQAPVENLAGWNNSNVTVTFTCTDAISGILSCTGPQTVQTEGKDQPVVGTAVDNANNSATDTASVSVDKTAPTISAAPDRAANGYGWYNDNVTVSYTVDDSLSGVAASPGSQTFGEGANQSASGTVTDAAGNSAGASITGINVDKTAPSLSGAPTSAPNGNGWYNGDVTIHWTCSDALSGIAGACPPNSTITGEGNNLSDSASVSDMAGNTKSATVNGIKIDRTAPATTDDAPQGWQKVNVVVQLTVSDALSGVGATYYKVDNGTAASGASVTISTDGTHNLEYWSVDKAGNAETHHTVTVLLDKTAPIISGAPTTSPNANGWYNGPVTVHFTCNDATSGIANCPANITTATNGANQTVTGTATDNAGNTASVTVGPFNIDTTAPIISVTANSAPVDGAIYTLGAVPVITCVVSDNGGSGVQGGCTVSTTGGLANGVGTYTYTATATDRAGNTITTVVHYRVIYRWDGFLQPINDTAHQTGTNTSIFRAGSTVPVKFQLKRADGTGVQANTLPLWLTPARGSSTAGALNEAVYGDPSSSGNTYRGDSQQYIYNWGTPGNGVNYYWRVGVTLDDGQTYYVNIGLR